METLEQTVVETTLAADQYVKHLTDNAHPRVQVNDIKTKQLIKSQIEIPYFEYTVNHTHTKQQQQQ